MYKTRALFETGQVSYSNHLTNKGHFNGSFIAGNMSKIS